MRDLTRLASRIVMFFMQFYYRLARHSRVSYKAYIDGRTRLAGYNTIQDNVLLAGARIGRGTYICRGSNFTDAEVGAFCSIGRNVRIVNGQHPTRTFVSTHPAFFSPNGQPGFSFAREIRKRFDDEQIAYLLASRWWERPFDELRKEADSFSDIGLFMKNGL